MLTSFSHKFLSEMAEISDITVKRTQDTLGKLIQKPVLTDKLLRKPPFKFLYDIIRAVSGNMVSVST